MAGLAEAAHAEAMVLHFGVLAVMVVALFVTLVNQSRIAAQFGLVLAFLSGLCCMPWLGFTPVQSDDPDAVYWAAEARFFAWCWVVVEVVTVIVSVCVVLLPHKPSVTVPGSSTPPPHDYRLPPPPLAGS